MPIGWIDLIAVDQLACVRKGLRSDQALDARLPQLDMPREETFQCVDVLAKLFVRRRLQASEPFCGAEINNVRGR